MWPITRPRRVVYTLSVSSSLSPGLSTHTSATSACADASRSFAFFLYLSALARSCSCTCIRVWNGPPYSGTYEWKSGERRKERRESRVTDSRVPRLSTEPATLRPMRRVRGGFDACSSDDSCVIFRWTINTAIQFACVSKYHQLSSKQMFREF